MVIEEEIFGKDCERQSQPLLFECTYKNMKTTNPSSASIMYNRTVLPAPFAGSRILSSP